MKRVELTCHTVGIAPRSGWPVTVGVPFADRELGTGTPVRVIDRNGQPLATQTQCLATWATDRQFVKWLLVDVQVDLPTTGSTVIILEYGEGAEPPPAPCPIHISKDEQSLSVGTGTLMFSYAPCSGRNWVPRFDTGHGLLADSPVLSLYVVDEFGTRYEASGEMEGVEVEESGPLRTSICIRGCHRAADGRRVLPYMLRMHFYAGKNFVRLDHTFVFDQDPHQWALGSLGLRVQSDFRDGFGMAFSEVGGGAVAAPLGRGRLLQLSDREYRLNINGDVAGTGCRTTGWATVAGRSRGVCMVLQDCWQEYPKAITADPTGIEVQLWPADAGPLRFVPPFVRPAVYFAGTRDEAEFARLVRENPEAPLNLKSLGAQTREELEWVERMVTTYAPDRPASYNDTGTSNGFGAAKTSTCWLMVSPDGIPAAEAERFGTWVQNRVVASATPGYLCDTDAVRGLAPREAAWFPAAESALDSVFDEVVIEPRHQLRTYGMVDYGDLMCSHTASSWAMWSHCKGTPQAREMMKHCSRAYNNEANDQVNALWCLYLHTGQPGQYLAAEAYGRHMADLDVIHLGPHAGLMHYHNAHHWSGPPSPSHTCIAGLMRQYYLTGNRRLLDVSREVVDWAVSHQEPCGILSNRDGALVREFTTPLANVLEWYQLTWDERYGELARRSLNWMLRSFPSPGQFPQSIFTAGPRGNEAVVEQEGWHIRHSGGMTPELFYDAVHLFPDNSTYREHLVGLARRYLSGLDTPFETIFLDEPSVSVLDPYFNAPLIAHAYDITGDVLFGAFCHFYVDHHFPQRARDLSFTAVAWGSIIPPLMRAARRALKDHGRQAIKAAIENWTAAAMSAQHVRDRGSGQNPRPLRRRNLGAVPVGG